MKKSIRILTSCGATDNYGSVLQAYALQRYLRDNYKDFDIKLLYAYPRGTTTTNPTKKSFAIKISERLKNIERPLRIYFNAYILRRKKYIKRIQKKKDDTLKEIAKSILQPINEARIEMFNKKREFERFKREHIALTSESLQDFCGFAPEYEADCYIVGSDQVWGGTLICGLTYGIDFYTLEFLPQNHKSKKISYATSFGKAEFSSEFEKEYFKNALSKFDAISLRESCNIATLKEIGLQSVCVPDPSQLLTKSDYEKLIDSSIKNGEFDLTKSDGKIRKDSVFVYMLSNEIAINKNKLMKTLQHSYNVIYTNANMCEFYCLWDYISDFAPTPQEWLACVRDCKVLITKIMNTPFVALAQGGVTEKENIRFTNMLELFDLQNRLVDNFSDLETQIKTPIDFESVNQKLDSWRNVGMEFLKENLAKI